MIILFVAIFSLIIGSFASCVSYRLAKNESWIVTRSKCPKCSATLQIKNLIPLFSWIFQKGKCANCHAKISLRYPLIELTFLVTFLIIYFCVAQKIDARFILLCLIATTLIIMSIIDLEAYFIPNSLQYILAIFTIIFVVLDGGKTGLKDNIGAAFLYAGFGYFLYLLFRFTANIDALGIDDIKLFFTFGLLLGASKFLVFILLSGIFGMVFGALWMKFKKDETFPFAPAICLAAMIDLMLSKKFNLVDVVASSLSLQSF